MKSVVVFGDSLPQRDLLLSFEHAGKSGLFVGVGSSLVVTPATDRPREGFGSGAKLVIVKQGETPFGKVAHLRFPEIIVDVFPKAAGKLKRKSLRMGAEAPCGGFAFQTLGSRVSLP